MTSGTAKPVLPLDYHRAVNARNPQPWRTMCTWAVVWGCLIAILCGVQAADSWATMVNGSTSADRSRARLLFMLSACELAAALAFAAAAQVSRRPTGLSHLALVSAATFCVATALLRALFYTGLGEWGGVRPLPLHDWAGIAKVGGQRLAWTTFPAAMGTVAYQRLRAMT